jgi:hypothetical protein
MSLVQVAIYSLCFLTCLGCGFLLLRGYGRNGARLLLWTGACFCMLSLNNLIVLLDLVIFVQEDLQGWRLAASLAAVATLIVGLVWESE